MNLSDYEKYFLELLLNLQYLKRNRQPTVYIYNEDFFFKKFTLYDESIRGAGLGNKVFFFNMLEYTNHHLTFPRLLTDIRS